MKALALRSHHWTHRLSLVTFVLLLLALPFLIQGVFADTVVNWTAVNVETGAKAYAMVQSPAALYDRFELASSVTGGKASGLLDPSSSSHALQTADTTPPVINYTLNPASPPLFSGGWYKSDVTLVWSVSEPESPASLEKTGCVDQNITQDQPATTYTCSAKSTGGSAGPVSVTVKRDMTPPPAPQIITTVNGAPYTPGTWANKDVFADVILPVDNMSGIASCTNDRTFTTQGGNLTFSANCTDKAGNTGPVTKITIKIDKTAPTGSPFVNPPSPTGWYKFDQAVTWNWGDMAGGSGIDPAKCPSSTNTSGTGVLHTATATCYDLAGNATTLQYAVMIDSTPPHYQGNSGGTVNGVPYTPGTWTKDPVTVKFYCVDGESGPVNAEVPETLSSEGANQTLTAPAADCVDKAGWTAVGNAGYTGIYIDKTAPLIKESGRTPGANTYGWNNSDVTVSFTCEDTGAAQSGIAVKNVPAATVTGEGQNLSVTSTGSCVDNAGNSAVPVTVGGINIDRTKPLITESARTPANSYKWNKTDVAVNFTCADTGNIQSGIAKDTVSSTPTTVSQEGENLTATSTGDCVDKAGWSAVPLTVSGINIDKTPPIYGTFNTAMKLAAASTGDVWATSKGNPYAPDTWTNAQVDVSFKCDDDRSGEVTTPIVVSVSQEGAGQYAKVALDKCRDYADNVAVQDRTFGPINIDKTAPVITPNRTPAANGAGWNNSDVTVSFSCADTGSAQSGIDKSTYTLNGGTLTGEGVGQQVTSTGNCSDVAGNIANPATVTVSGINIDKTPPVIMASPPAGSYLVGCTTPPTFNANDALSGVDGDVTVQGPVPTGPWIRFTATAKDKAGNVTNPPQTFDYLAYKLDDPFFLSPVDAHSTSLFKMGSVVPIKFQLRDCNDIPITTADARLKIEYLGPSAPRDDFAVVGTGQGGDTGDKFRLTGDGYQYNWKSKGVWVGDYRISVKISGTILRSATIGLR